MNIAETLARELSRAGAYKAVSLRSGYAVPQAGERYLFGPTTIVLEKRNNGGRVCRQHAEFPDGSVLEFTWSPNGGARYRALQGVKPAAA